MGSALKKLRKSEKKVEDKTGHRNANIEGWKTGTAYRTTLPQTSTVYHATLPETSTSFRTTSPQTSTAYRDTLPQTSTTYRTTLPQASTTYRTTLPQTGSTYRDTLPQTNTTYRTTLPQTSTTYRTTLSHTSTTYQATLPQTSTAYRATLPQTRSTYHATLPQTSTNYRATLPQTNAVYRATLPQTSTTYRTSLPQTSTAYHTTLPQTSTTYRTTLPQTSTAYHTTFPQTSTTYRTTLPQTSTLYRATSPQTNTVYRATLPSSQNVSSGEITRPIGATETYDFAGSSPTSSISSNETYTQSSASYSSTEDDYWSEKDTRTYEFAGESPASSIPSNESYTQSSASYSSTDDDYWRTKLNQGPIVVGSTIAQSGAASNTYPQSFPTKETADSISRAIAKARASHTPWEDEEIIVDELDVPIDVARNVLTLLKEGCTIPFIVRYRSDMTGGLNADEIREIQDLHEKLTQVHKKVETILKTVKHEKFDEKAAASLLRAKTLEEVDIVYAPFKPENKKTLAEIARRRGLEPVAIQLATLERSLQEIDLSAYIKPNDGLRSEEDVRKGIQHIIANIIWKNRTILDFVKEKTESDGIRIYCTKTAEAVGKDLKAEEEGRESESAKYENYFKFNIPLNNIAPHHILALNRGEKQKILKVKVKLSPVIKREVTDFCWKTVFSKKLLDVETSKFLKSCVDDSYSRLIEPHMCSLIRSTLKSGAGKDSISIFCSNVKSLLLSPPLRGETVIGIDPGFYHGCKTAVVSPEGDVWDTEVLYPHSNSKLAANAAFKLRRLISDYEAEYIAIGNGTACRETETWLSSLITSGYFSPFGVKYCIINESGVSIWSVTREAEEEFPDLEPNLRSAVSIARRLQDPLLEYAKVMPRHLGVGMYQHDIPEDELNKGFDSVFEECASFVGVDLNICPSVLLRKVSGLSESSADNIVNWRETNGPFVHREDLMKVLDWKTYQQCAGFVKILPETCLYSRNKKAADLNPLDTTIIHPESYEIARTFLRMLLASTKEIGSQSLVDKVDKYMLFTTPEDIAEELQVETEVMELIIKAFKQLQDYDIREEFERPLFKTNVRSFSDLTNGQELTGRICNLTAFGAFVDIGVGKDGLIHSSQMRGQTVNVGDRVRVKVLNVEYERKRISLQLCI